MALVGPTAVGKSAVAVEIAPELGAEIVSIDSMQVYEGMDIGTDKAAPALRARVTHHLLEVAPASREVTVAEFQSLGRAAIADIASRSRLPFLVGGSGLYFRAVVDHFEFPERASSVRRALEEELRRVGARTLHAKLARVDPVAAARIEPTNSRRTVRALEAIEVTGRPFSDSYTWGRYESVYDLRVAGITLPREVLYERVVARVERMLRAGLVEEVRGLQEVGIGPTARQALGYRQVLEAPSDATRDELKAAIVSATKRLVRRQESWFRSDPRIRWFDGAAEGLTRDLVAYLHGTSG